MTWRRTRARARGDSHPRCGYDRADTAGDPAPADGTHFEPAAGGTPVKVDGGAARARRGTHPDGRGRWPGSRPTDPTTTRTTTTGRRTPRRRRTPLPPPTVPPAGYAPDDREFDDALRPKRLADVVGQRRVVERMGITLDAARRRGDPLGHLLLDGPPGLGKTTLAMVVPRGVGHHPADHQRPGAAGPQGPRQLPDHRRAGQRAVHRRDPPPAAGRRRVPPTRRWEDFRVDIV